MRKTRRLCRWLVLAAAILQATAVTAADVKGSQDHPLLSRFPGTTIVAYESWPYHRAMIAQAPTKSQGFTKGKWVDGKLTWIVYQAPRNISTLQWYRNYETALKGAGFETEFSCQKDDCGSNFIRHMLDATGRTVTDGTAYISMEHYMPDTARYLAAKLPSDQGDIWVSLLVHERNSAGVAAARLEMIEPGKPRELSDLSGTNIGSKDVDYDEARVIAGKGDNVLELEGKIRWRAFRYERGVSTYEAFMSWLSYLRSNGYERQFACYGENCGSGFTRDVIDLNGLIAKGGETWSRDTQYYELSHVDNTERKGHLSLLIYEQPNGLTVSRSLSVSQQPTAFDQIKVSAESLAQDLEDDGKVAVYGIRFDTDSAEIKPESAETLEEIARLMAIRPELLLYVDGHTDDQGESDYNLDLSLRRATAVVHALQARDVEAARLEARGFGENVPVDTNETEAGRSKNRRVELVTRQPED